MTRKPQSQVRILKYRTWTIGKGEAKALEGGAIARYGRGGAKVGGMITMFSWAERRSDNFQDQWEREEKGYFQDQCQMVMTCSKEKY